MNGRRALLLAAMCAAASAVAQPSLRVPRVVVLGSWREPGKEKFRALFSERGWKVGENLELEFNGLRGSSSEERRQRARELVASNPDLIIGPGDASAPLLMSLTSTIPIVFYNYGQDPVRAGLVQSLRRPGGNVTGTTQLLTHLIPKLWELVKTFRPQARRAAWLDTANGYLTSRFAPAIREQNGIAAKRNALSIIEVMFPAGSSLVEAQAAVDASGAELALVADTVDGMPWVRDLLKHLERRAIPSVHRQGGLISLSPDFLEGERQAVAIVDRILRGEKPATIPVYEATRYHVAVNAKIARAMGLRIPPSILLLANEVIDR